MLDSQSINEVFITSTFEFDCSILDIDSDSSSSASSVSFISSHDLSSILSTSTSSSESSDLFYSFKELPKNIRAIIGNLDVFNCYSEIFGAFSLLLGCSMNDLISVIDVTINISTINRRELDYVQLTTNTPRKNRTIDTLSPIYYHQTRFISLDLKRLYSLFLENITY